VAVVTPRANANGSAQTASAALGVVVAHHDSARPVSVKVLLVGCCEADEAAVVAAEEDNDDDVDDDDDDEGVNDSVAWLRSSRLAGEERPRLTADKVVRQNQQRSTHIVVNVLVLSLQCGSSAHKCTQTFSSQIDRDSDWYLYFFVVIHCG